MDHEQGRLRGHVAVAAEGDRRSLHVANGPPGSPTRGPTSSTPASPRCKAEPGHEVYKISDEQLGEWKKSAEPLKQKWADGVKKAGGDPDAIYKGLEASLTQYNAGF